MTKSETFNKKVRSVQSMLGPTATRFVMKLLGQDGTRLVRELLGRSARHRVQTICSKELFGIGNAAWMVSPDGLSEESIIYSVGIGTEISFELALIEKYRAHVYAFDPTPVALTFIKSQDLPQRFHFIDYGVTDFDGVAKFDHIQGAQYTITTSAGCDACSSNVFEVRRIQTVMKELGHCKIDLLKMNIEGGEYRVIDDMIGSNADINQLVLEFHHRLAGFSLSQTTEAVEALNQAGYKIFHISDGKEYSFIRL